MMSHINPNIRGRLGQRKTALQSADYYIQGIVKRRDHFVLSEAITIVESDQSDHQRLGLEILKGCYEHRVPSIRYGITGSPGVGKSTFINSIASSFVKEGSRVGILTIDPSSVTSKGSILGDKTRMDDIVDHPDIYIRPSASILHLGGLHPFTYETMILCEAAGMDRLLVETVGVGQSEIEVNAYTDATVLLVMPGGGDSLQGIKKGIVENADIIIVHKSDGDALELAMSSAQEYREAIHLARTDKVVPVLNYSSITGHKKSEVTNTLTSIVVDERERRAQETMWWRDRIQKIIDAKVEIEFEKMALITPDTTEIMKHLQDFSDHLTVQLYYKRDEH